MFKVCTIIDNIQTCLNSLQTLLLQKQTAKIKIRYECIWKSVNIYRHKGNTMIWHQKTVSILTTVFDTITVVKLHKSITTTCNSFRLLTVLTKIHDYRCLWGHHILLTICHDLHAPSHLLQRMPKNKEKNVKGLEKGPYGGTYIY